MIKRGSITFEQWCLDNDKEWMLDTWDYDSNNCSPSDIAFTTNRKFCFHCGNQNHKSENINIKLITSGDYRKTRETFCSDCRSVYEYVYAHRQDIDIDAAWSEKNEVAANKVSVDSDTFIWLKCLAGKNHPDYDMRARALKEGSGCPYCAGKRVCKENSLGYFHPIVFDLWSDLNEKTPYDYTCGSAKDIFLKCNNGIHDDYKRRVQDCVRINFVCPICARKNKVMPHGKDHPNWNPNRSADSRIRTSNEYLDWRKLVFERDNYTCVCCGNTGRLNAHHIYAFSNYKELRLDINNGITLCNACHNVNSKGSLHNVYGTQDVSPQQLDDYINSKRKTLGISEIFSVDQYIAQIDGSTVSKSA